MTVLTRQKQQDGASWTERSYQNDDVIMSDLLPNFPGTVAALWADVEFEED